MKFFEYVDRMVEDGGILATVALAALALFLLFIIFKMLGGVRRGGWRQLIRTLATLAAAVVSYFLAVILSDHIIGSLNVTSLEGLITRIEAYLPQVGEMIRGGLQSINTEIIEYVILLPATIILVPIIATLVFLLINLVFKIIRSIIIKIFGFKRAKTNSQRLYGALLAVVEAIIWITMVLFPVCSLLTLVDQAYDQAVSSTEEGESNAIIDTYDEYLRPFTENPAIDLICSMGTDVMADKIATVNIDGEKTNMRDEVLAVVNLVIVEGDDLKGADFSALDDEGKAAVDKIISTLYESPYMSRLLVGAIQSCSGLLSSGVIPIEIDESYAHLIEELTVFLESVDRDTLNADLNTVKNIYYALSDSGIIGEIKAGNTDILSILDARRQEGDDVVSNIIAILKGNQRTSSLITSMTKVLISNISTTITVDGVELEVSYESVKDSVNEVLSIKKESFATDEEYKEELSNALDNALTNNGIELEDEIVDGIADHIGDNYSDFEGELTDEDFNDILLKYYDVYVGYIGSGELPEGLPEGVFPNE